MRPEIKAAANDLAALLDQAERKFDRVVDTTKVRAHLAAMEASDFGDELVARLDKLHAHANRLRRSAQGEVGDVLQQVSDACLKLKREILH